MSGLDSSLEIDGLLGAPLRILFNQTNFLNYIFWVSWPVKFLFKLSLHESFVLLLYGFSMSCFFCTTIHAGQSASTFRHYLGPLVVHYVSTVRDIRWAMCSGHAEH